MKENNMKKVIMALDSGRIIKSMTCLYWEGHLTIES